MLSMATTDSADLSRIQAIPGQRSGQPCIRGLRVTVWDALDTVSYTHLDVYKRQADLIVPGRARIQNAPRNIQMRFRIAVIREVAAPMEEPDPSGAPETQQREDRRALKNPCMP